MGSRRTELPPGGSPLPSPPPQRRRCGSGGRRGLAAGRAWLPGRVEGDLAAFSEGGAVAHPPGDGATAKGGAAVPGRKAACDRRSEGALGRLPAALLQGRCARRPAGGAAGSSGQQ